MGILSHETSGWQSPAVGGRSLGGGVGIAGEKARHGGLRGMAGAAAGSVFGVGGAAHRRPQSTGGCCLAGGGWRLRGVEVEDEL